MSREKTLTKKTSLPLIAALFIFAGSIGCAGGPLTTRESSALVGTGVGAAAGGIIGSTVGHPGAGAAIGGALGLGTGALLGDQLQGQENRSYYQEDQIRRDQYELERQHREIERLRREQGEY